MKIIHFLSKALLTALVLTNPLGCDEETPAIPQNPEPDGEALHQWFDTNTENQEQHFSLTSSTGGNITGEKGTIVKFGANAFTKLNGDPVTGSVDITLIELYDRASMLLAKKPTNGKMSDGSVSTLVSGGEFYINVTQGGVQLNLKSGFTIVAPTENTGEIDQEMNLFNGEINCDGDDCDLVWQEVKDRGIEIGEFQTTGGFKTAYYAFQSKFGWTNIDRWYSDPRIKTKLFVKVPEGYDRSNCAVYMTYDGEPTALASFDAYDNDKKLFTEHYGLIPIGLKVHFIFVSIVEDEIHYALQSATIVENHIETINDVKAITQEQLVDLVDALP
jgi:hypothetical protein